MCVHVCLSVCAGFFLVCAVFFASACVCVCDYAVKEPLLTRSDTLESRMWLHSEHDDNTRTRNNDNTQCVNAVNVPHTNSAHTLTNMYHICLQGDRHVYTNIESPMTQLNYYVQTTRLNFYNLMSYKFDLQHHKIWVVKCIRERLHHFTLCWIHLNDRLNPD